MSAPNQSIVNGLFFLAALFGALSGLLFAWLRTRWVKRLAESESELSDARRQLRSASKLRLTEFGARLGFHSASPSIALSRGTGKTIAVMADSSCGRGGVAWMASGPMDEIVLPPGSDLILTTTSPTFDVITFHVNGVRFTVRPLSVPDGELPGATQAVLLDAAQNFVRVLSEPEPGLSSWHAIAEMSYATLRDAVASYELTFRRGRS